MSLENSSAKYTMTLHDYLKIDNEWFDTHMTMSNSDRTANFRKALTAMWGIYEISAETVGQFRIYLSDTFAIWCDYYDKMIDTYERDYDFESGVDTKVTTTDKSIHVALPNKKIDQKDIYAYPDSGDKTESSVTTTNMDKFISLKLQYMKQIRNLYNEFATRFYDCFIHIY